MVSDACSPSPLFLPFPSFPIFKATIPVWVSISWNRSCTHYNHVLRRRDNFVISDQWSVAVNVVQRQIFQTEMSWTVFEKRPECLCTDSKIDPQKRFKQVKKPNSNPTRTSALASKIMHVSTWIPVTTYCSNPHLIDSLFGSWLNKLAEKKSGNSIMMFIQEFRGMKIILWISQILE